MIVHHLIIALRIPAPVVLTSTGGADGHRRHRLRTAIIGGSKNSGSRSPSPRPPALFRRYSVDGRARLKKNLTFTRRGQPLEMFHDTSQFPTGPCQSQICRQKHSPGPTPSDIPDPIPLSAHPPSFRNSKQNMPSWTRPTECVQTDRVLHDVIHPLFLSLLSLLLSLLFSTWPIFFCSNRPLPSSHLFSLCATHEIGPLPHITKLNIEVQALQQQRLT